MINSAKEAVMLAFKRGEWLTDYDADRKCYCRHFRSVMTKLRRSGWKFHEEWVVGKNRFGNHSRWKRYKLIKAGLRPVGN